MTKMQMTALENAQKMYGDKEFTARDWDKVACGKFALNTAIYKGYVQKIEHIKRNYYTLAEIVAMLNDCSGEDCYCGHWEYKIDENNRVYDEDVTITYKLI